MSYVALISPYLSMLKGGKGNPYADRFNHHMPLFDAMQTASRKVFKRAFGY